MHLLVDRYTDVLSTACARRSGSMERDPAAVLQAAIRGVVDRLPESVKEDKADSVTFQPAKFFVGRKDGFYFGTGPEGTG